MMTFFTMPKPFRGHIGVIQRNAIRSWLLLGHDYEIILCGNDYGTAEVADEFKLRHIPHIDSNEYGTPLISSLFEKVQTESKYNILNYINSDIILFQDFVKVIDIIPKDFTYLVLGLRWDIDITEHIAFDDSDWEIHLKRRTAERGVLHSSCGVDYYIFPKWLWREIPPFAIGRTSYDNWLIYKAKVQDARIIDATKIITCVHQNHERTYSSIGYRSSDGDTSLVEGIEAKRNKALLGGNAYIFTLEDADWIADGNSVFKKSLTVKRFIRYCETLSVLYPSFTWLFFPIKVLFLIKRVCNGIQQRLNL